MNLGRAQNLQKLFVALCTDTQLRAQWQVDPNPICKAFDVEMCEDDLHQLSGERLETFATSLRAKRARILQHAFPLTADHLGEEAFGACLDDYTHTPLRSSVTRTANDVSRFASYLVKQTRASPRAVRETIGYESRSQRAQRRGPYLGWVILRHGLPQERRQERRIEHERPIPEPSRKTPRRSRLVRPRLIVWIRPSARSRLRIVVI